MKTSCTAIAPVQPNNSGICILGPLLIKFKVHQPISRAAQKEPITKKTIDNICIPKPSPIRIKVPEAHPPARTMPIPNRKAPATVAKLIGTTKPIPGIGKPFILAPYWTAINPIEVIASAIKTALVSEVLPDMIGSRIDAVKQKLVRRRIKPNAIPVNQKKPIIAEIVAK